jgi:hypothetical protein
MEEIEIKLLPVVILELEVFKKSQPQQQQLQLQIVDMAKIMHQMLIEVVKEMFNLLLK